MRQMSAAVQVSMEMKGLLAFTFSLEIEQG